MVDESVSGVVSKIESLGLTYSERYLVRASVQAIPYIGGAIDTILSGRASKIQMERIESFNKALALRMEAVEAQKFNVDLDDEAFADLIIKTFDAVARTRSSEKRLQFSEIIANQAMGSKPWEEAESAVRLLSELEEIHLNIMISALTAPELKGAFSGLRVVTLNDKSFKDEESESPLSLLKLYSQYGSAALRMACSELSAKGLLHDEGVGRLSLGAMAYFVPTELAEWFYGWINRTES